MDGILFTNFYTLKMYTVIEKQDSQTIHLMAFQPGMLLLKQRKSCCLVILSCFF